MGITKYYNYYQVHLGYGMGRSDAAHALFLLGVLWGGLRDYRMNPTGQFLNVLLEHLTVNHSEEQTRLLVINGIIINISSIHEVAHTLTIKDRLIIAGNNLGDRHVVTTFHHASGNAGSVDGRVICSYEEKANKKTCFVGTMDIINLVISRKNVKFSVHPLASAQRNGR